MLESIRPFPKVSTTLKKNTINRRKRTTAILTETPEKIALEEEAARIRKKNATKAKERFQRKKKDIQLNSWEDDDALCLYCLRPNSSDNHGEEWGNANIARVSFRMQKS